LTQVIKVYKIFIYFKYKYAMQTNANTRKGTIFMLLFTFVLFYSFVLILCFLKGLKNKNKNNQGN